MRLIDAVEEYVEFSRRLTAATQKVIEVVFKWVVKFDFDVLLFLIFHHLCRIKKKKNETRSESIIQFEFFTLLKKTLSVYSNIMYARKRAIFRLRV